MSRKGLLPVRPIEVVDPGCESSEGFGRCEIGKDIRLDPERLVSYRLGRWESVIEDALVICAAVEYCDRRQCRPKSGWGRVFPLRIHVHEPARWMTPAVLGSLTAALRCLTGDVWRLEFVQRTSSPDNHIQSNFEVPSPNSVMVPYSRGMDSWAVSRLLAGQPVVRVQVGQSLGRRRQNAEPFERIPFRVPDQNFKERSGRARGFKFAMVSGLAAYLSGAKTVVIPESGQGALGPVLVTHRYGDYRSHPVFLRKMEAIFRALLNHEIRYDFPRLWSTKGRTLREAITDSGDGSWTDTRSCWQKPRQISVGENQLLRQCGYCAACILRRLSVHAAGLAESSDTYALEDLSAPRMEAGMARGFDLQRLQGKQQDYAVAGAMHFDHLAALRKSEDQQGALGLAVRELARALDETEGSVTQSMNEMLAEHEEEWWAFVRSLSPNSFIRQRCAAVS
jgi:7-cyano-7-deazaguanine synthase in queuosine biosynthesis